MTHSFKSASGRTFTAEKKDGNYVINGCAVATKNFCWFGVNGKEAEVLCENLGIAPNTSIKIIIDRAEFSRLMEVFANETKEAIAKLPVQYRIEDITVNADGDIVVVGKKIVEFKTEASGVEHIIIEREYKNAELTSVEVTVENAPQIIEQVYATREAAKIAEAAKKPEYEITYHGDHEMWNGVRMD